MTFNKVVFDIETTMTADKIWCIVCKHGDTYYQFKEDRLHRFAELIKQTDEVIGHNIIGFDIRASLSTEINIKEYATEGKAYNKYRVSYTEPNKKFKVDFTAVKEGQLLNREFVPDDDSSETTYQIEIELLSNDIDIDEFFKFTFSLVSLN